MKERIDSWFISLLPKLGAIDDPWAHGWIYLAVTKKEGSLEKGFLYDLQPDEANTREEALTAGRKRFEEVRQQSEEFCKADILEDWAYTTDETKNLEFRTFSGGTRPSQIDGGCGCGSDD